LKRKKSFRPGLAAVNIRAVGEMKRVVQLHDSSLRCAQTGHWQGKEFEPFQVKNRAVIL